MSGHFYSGCGKYLSFSQAISFFSDFTGSALWPFISEIKFSLHVTLRDTFYLWGGKNAADHLSTFKNLLPPVQQCQAKVKGRQAA